MRYMYEMYANGLIPELEKKKKMYGIILGRVP
jgi:hypothetical protein